MRNVTRLHNMCVIKINVEVMSAYVEQIAGRDSCTMFVFLLGSPPHLKWRIVHLPDGRIHIRRTLQFEL